MSRTSVVTLHKDRRAHLTRLLEGLERGSPPDECIVVEMGEDDAPLPAMPFPLRRILCRGDRLPLAAARNAGRRATDADTLIFLDVDCIPSAGLVSGLASAAAEHDGLICCEIRYLPAGAVSEGWREPELARLGLVHPARDFPATGVSRVENPGLFWSLAFAVRTTTFDRLGGFDEGFSGYGAEDTDLAFRAAAIGVPVLFAGGMRAFHQHHASCDPPLQHFDDIVRNARRFRARHGVWPMPGWLDAFAELGLIARERQDDLVVMRAPTQTEIEAARLPLDRPF